MWSPQIYTYIIWTKANDSYIINVIGEVTGGFMESEELQLHLLCDQQLPVISDACICSTPNILVLTSSDESDFSESSRPVILGLTPWCVSVGTTCSPQNEYCVKRSTAACVFNVPFTHFHSRVHDVKHHLKLNSVSVSGLLNPSQRVFTGADWHSARNPQYGI